MASPALPDPLADLRVELADLRAAGLLRTLRSTHGPVGPAMTIEGQPVLNFCSNNYLGLANHPSLIAAACAAMEDEGLGAGAARLIGGSLAVHARLEAQIARWKGTEAALLFGSGYQANLGILGALAGPADAIYSDALNHASLIDGARLSRAAIHVYPHNDLGALAALLEAGRDYRRRIIATESVFSMDGDTAPVAAIVGLAGRFGALVVTDDAHASGVLGEAGVGLSARLGAHVQMGTLGKAFGAGGAYATGAREVIELLVNRARSFVFTTAQAVPIVAAAEAALAIVAGSEGAARREQLRGNVTLLRRGLGRLGLTQPVGSPGHIFPVIVGDSVRAVELSQKLLERGLFVQAIRPPTVLEGTARLRITLMATHLPAHIERLVEALGELRSLLHP